MKRLSFVRLSLWILLCCALSLCGCAKEEASTAPEEVVTEPEPEPELELERTVRTSSWEEPLPHKIIYRDTDSLYVGQERTEVQGQDGYCIYELCEVLINGVCISQERTETERIEPIDTVILRGTRPAAVPTGTFRYPIRSAVTSYYGWRTLNGARDFHYGIDLRAAVGTSVCAADGGIVSFAGTMSGISATYGKLIIIDHQNGYKTYYAHLSSFAVKAGDAVYQGQVIGKSGITGNVTGPHLHFEIRLHNKTKNPLLYLQ